MQSASDVGSARAQLMEDIHKIVSDSESLLRAVASVPGDKARELRDSLEENIAHAKGKLREIQGAAYERTTAAARAADTYVHDNPWPIIGAAALAGFVLGCIFTQGRGD